MESTKTSPKLIMVTGCNRGIGYGIIENLAKSHPEYHFLMATRTLENGKAALQKLQLTFPGIEKRVIMHDLDISKSASIDAFVSWIKSTGIKVDCLVNNAGYGKQTQDVTPELVKATFETNAYGTYEITEKMLPLLPDGAKIVFVSSGLGTYGIFQGFTLRDRLEDPKLSRADIKAIADDFCDRVRAGKPLPFEGGMWPVYSFSKLLLSVYVRTLGGEEEIKKRRIQVYACHPGWVKTDLGGPMAPLTLEEGTVCPCYLINLPWEFNEEYQGKYFAESKVASL